MSRHTKVLKNQAANLTCNSCDNSEDFDIHSSESSSLKIENKDEWLNTREAADFLRISPKRLLNLTSFGRVPFYKFGRSNRYLKSELDKLLRAQPIGVLHGNKIR